MSDLLLRKAISLARAGRRQEARDLFIQLVTEDEENELAWLWLVDLVDEREDQIIALENALTINPHNEKARLHLEKLEADSKHTEPAPIVPPVPAPHELDEAPLSSLAANTTFTLLRLSLGPFFLYLFLILIQGAYRPWRIPPLYYLGGIIVLAGSLLVVGSSTTPRHPGWRILLGEEGLRSNGERLLWGAVGLVLLALPYLGFLAVAYRRLQTTPGAPLPGG